MLKFKGAIFLLLCVVLLECQCQQYDFAAEISRQCLVPDPVGLLDCVENKVTLPYLTSWVDCTNSLGENVRTSADIINYRCKSVWEGKGVIPEVFYIKDCVIEKTGLPAKNVSAEVLGAYKECESNPTVQQRPITQAPQNPGIKTAPIQQTQITQNEIKSVSTQQQSPTFGVKTTSFQQQTSAGYVQGMQPAPPMPAQQPISQQAFSMYPQAPLQPPQQSPVTQTQQRQLPPPSYNPPYQLLFEKIPEMIIPYAPQNQQQLALTAPPMSMQPQTPPYSPQVQQVQQPFIPPTPPGQLLFQKIPVMIMQSQARQQQVSSVPFANQQQVQVPPPQQLPQPIIQQQQIKTAYTPQVQQVAQYALSSEQVARFVPQPTYAYRIHVLQ